MVILRLLSSFPFDKLLLSFLALVESEDIRYDAASDCFNLVLRNIGVVDQLFASAPIVSSVDVILSIMRIKSQSEGAKANSM